MQSQDPPPPENYSRLEARRGTISELVRCSATASESVWKALEISVSIEVFLQGRGSPLDIKAQQLSGLSVQGVNLFTQRASLLRLLPKLKEAGGGFASHFTLTSRWEELCLH